MKQDFLECTQEDIETGMIKNMIAYGYAESSHYKILGLNTPELLRLCPQPKFIATTSNGHVVVGTALKVINSNFEKMIMAFRDSNSNVVIIDDVHSIVNYSQTEEIKTLVTHGCTVDLIWDCSFDEKHEKCRHYIIKTLEDMSTIPVEVI